MPILLYCVGGLAVAVGAAMIAVGIPNNEFGIGNTLIVAGTTAIAGGLVVGALGVAVAQLQRVVEALATRAPVRSSRPFDTFDPAAAVAAGAAARPAQPLARVPFPPKTKPEFRPEPPAEIGQRDVFPQPSPREALARETSQREPLPRESHSETAQDFDAPAFSAPTLSNPDEPPVTAADEAYLSPLHPVAPPPFADRETPPPAPRKASTYFDAMWPAEPKPAEPAAPEPRVSEFQWSDVRRSEPSPVDANPADEPLRATDDNEPVAENDLHAQEDDIDDSEAPRNVAILKSGVVDGMGYTLYVDGSIEAELPQGTLRFASINELRSHLEKTS